MTEPMRSGGPVSFTEPGAIVFLPETTTGFTEEEIYRFFGLTEVPDALVAAADVMSGAMVALVPAQEDIDRFVVPGGEPADQLHLTLWYLGDAANIDDQTRQDILDTLIELAASQPIVVGNVMSLSVFNPTGPEPCLVLGVSGADLVDVHEAVEEILLEVDAPLNYDHVPWLPHVTLDYLTPPVEGVDVGDEAAQRMGPVTFDRIRIAFAGEVTDLPLGGNTP